MQFFPLKKRKKLYLKCNILWLKYIKSTGAAGVNKMCISSPSVTGLTLYDCQVHFQLFKMEISGVMTHKSSMYEAFFIPQKSVSAVRMCVFVVPSSWT